MSEVAQFESVQSIDGLIKQAVFDAIQAPSLREQVQKAADKAVAEAISSAFGYGSPFREGIQEAVKQALPIVSVDDLASFANACRVVVQRRLQNCAEQTAAANLDRVLEQILPSNPIITMEDFKTAYREKLSVGSDCHCDTEYDSFTWDVTDSDNDNLTGHYWDLRVAPESSSGRYSDQSATLRFREFKESNGLSECWYAQVGKDAEKLGSVFMGPLYGFDAMVWRLATGTAKMKR